MSSIPFSNQPSEPPPQTRGQEVVLQSLPQGFFQCLVLLRMAKAGEATSWVQWASVAGAALSIAFIVAETERGIDKSKKFRKDYPHVHGYFPDDKCRAFLVSFGTFCFIGCTLSCRCLAHQPAVPVAVSSSRARLTVAYFSTPPFRYPVLSSVSVCLSCRRASGSAQDGFYAGQRDIAERYYYDDPTRPRGGGEGR